MMLKIGLVTLGFIVGTILGSLVKALADRSLKKTSFWGRSYCESCKHKLFWYDLFPVLSYLFLKGKCRYCSTKLSIEYLVVETTFGLLVAAIFLNSMIYFPGLEDQLRLVSFVLDLSLKVFFVTVLGILFITDIKDMFIPDRVILPSIFIGLAYVIGLAIFKIWYIYYSLSLSPIGRLLIAPENGYFYRHALMVVESVFYNIAMGVLIGGFFLSLIIITRGKGMGGGDVKLGAFIGLILGFPNGILAIMLSFLTGAVYSIFLIIFGKKHFGQTIPFGPFLVLGSLITLFWGERIIDWYLHLSI